MSQQDQELQSVREQEAEAPCAPQAVEQAEDKEQKGGKKKRDKQPLTPEQKRSRRLKGLLIAGVVLGCIAVVIGVLAIVNAVGQKGLTTMAQSFDQVDYQGQQLVPTQGEDGRWYFTTDRDLKVMQITDVHVGAGFASFRKDGWALNAVATMITQEKPDLVVVTGDVVFPLFVTSGSFRNLPGAKIFGEMMESLGVYWTMCMGNHESEAYAVSPLKAVNDLYLHSGWKYCIYTDAEPIDGDRKSFGYGNQVVEVRNAEGLVKQALVLLDSHSYTGGDVLGAMHKFDNVHLGQIQWYAQEMDAINARNRLIDSTVGDCPNMLFFHIPTREYRTAWVKVREWMASDANTTGKDFTTYQDAYPQDPIVIDGDVTYVYGVMGESDRVRNGEQTYGVYPGVPDATLYPVVDGVEQDGLLLQAGFARNLTAIFCGHDHYNNFSVEYKGVRLTYGMSIDYLAYSGIWKVRSQRGCTIITVGQDGSFDVTPRNYYEDYDVTQPN